MAVNQELLSILACPQCKGSLRLEASPQALCCDVCKLRYAIRDDIPIMLVEEAEKLG